jgi:hypothetical protein
MPEQFNRQPTHPSSFIPHPSVRHWWEQATEQDQDAVLANVRLCRSLAGVPGHFCRKLCRRCWCGGCGLRQRRKDDG